MKKLSRYTTFLIISAAALLSCKKDQQPQNTVYMPQAQNLVKLAFEMTDTPYLAPLSAMLTGTDYATVSSVAAANDIVVHFMADTAKVAAFNAENGTQYPLLPAGAYEVPATATISKGTTGTINANIIIKAKGNIDPFQDYMLPVSITRIDGATADKYQQTIYYVVNATADLNSMVPYDESNWTIAGFSTEEPAEGGGNGYAKAAIDNNPDSYWHSKWSGGEPGPPHFIIVDMGEEKAVHGFGIMDRYFEGDWQVNGHGQPQDMTISVSTDNSNWSDVAVVKNIPHDEGQPWYRYFVSTLKTARYVKFTVTRAYATSSTSIAEVQVF